MCHSNSYNDALEKYFVAVEQDLCISYFPDGQIPKASLKLEEGAKIPVLLEKIEHKNGDVLVSATKAQKIKGWRKLEVSFEKNDPMRLVILGAFLQ